MSWDSMDSGPTPFSRSSLKLQVWSVSIFRSPSHPPTTCCGFLPFSALSQYQCLDSRAQQDLLDSLQRCLSGTHPLAAASSSEKLLLWPVSHRVSRQMYTETNECKTKFRWWVPSLKLALFHYNSHSFPPLALWNHLLSDLNQAISLGKLIFDSFEKKMFLTSYSMYLDY